MVEIAALSFYADGLCITVDLGAESVTFAHDGQSPSDGITVDMPMMFRVVHVLKELIRQEAHE